MSEDDSVEIEIGNQKIRVSKRFAEDYGLLPEKTKTRPRRERAWKMKKSYVISLFCLLLSQLVFLFVAWYHTDVAGRSWIWFHQPDWIWSFVLAMLALVFFVTGLVTDH